jgi:hypothetical protein
MTPDEHSAATLAANDLRNRDYAVAVSAVLATYEGRSFIWELLTRTGYFGASFAGEFTHETAFREGKRDIGARTMADIEAIDAGAWTQLKLESAQREQRYHVIPTTQEDNE